MKNAKPKAKPAARATSPKPVLVTASVLATRLGVTRQRVYQLKRFGMPVSERSKTGFDLFDVDASRRWCAANNQAINGKRHTLPTPPPAPQPAPAPSTPPEAPATPQAETDPLEGILLGKAPAISMADIKAHDLGLTVLTRRVELRKELGMLVPSDETAMLMTRALTEVRRLLDELGPRISSAVSSRLQLEPDKQARVLEVVRDEVGRLLNAASSIDPQRIVKSAAMKMEKKRRVH